MNETVDYIIGFMLGDRVDKNAVRQVGYTSDRSKFGNYRVVIIPSGFFDESVYGTRRSLPALPLKKIDGIPFLFGTDNIEYERDTLIIHADLIASACFLLSRCEEFLKRSVRDEHRRFPGKESLPYLAGFLDRPVVDEYGVLLRKWLGFTGADGRIKKVNFTHDIDCPFYCRSWRNVLHLIKETKNPFHAVRQKFRTLHDDRYFTYPFFLEKNDEMKQILKEKCDTLLFFKAGGKAKQDRPRYSLADRDIREIIALCEKYSVKTGLHGSYRSSGNADMIAAEKAVLEEALGRPVTDNRHHFLASREPEDMENLIKAGITDDYTMGYADVAGFRLGTSRPVRFINPATRQVKSLTLHPLLIMDSTLHAKKYMHMRFEAAEHHCSRIMENVCRVDGEFTVLWHNTSFGNRKDMFLHNLYMNFFTNLMDKI